MNNENFHPVREIPQMVHALHKWDADHSILSYEYNGIDIIKIKIRDKENIGFRHGSDGSMQSIQYIQQIYITADKPIVAEITFTLGNDAVNMRPSRAGGDQAILGQVGCPLITGVNGLYDVNQDLLIDFHGCEWSWCSRRMEREESGRLVARARVIMGQKPFFVNLRMQYYQKHLGYRYYEPWKFKPQSKSVAGWCSWEGYRRDINAEKIEAISDFMAKKLKDYGLTYIQVDDGYQKMPLPVNAEKGLPNGWMQTEENKFPGGHSQIVKTICEKGMVPAIWTNANITNEEFPERHPDCVLWYQNQPLKGEWIDFVLSCTPETLKEQIKPLFENFKKCGYQYVKIDAIRHLLFDGLHEAVRLGMITDTEAQNRFRAFMQATRDGLGKDIFYLASWGVLQEVVGIADACRIAMDANPTWAGIRMQIFESARWFHAQRILFLMDPDHVCVRTKPDWAKSILSLISLSGELYMLSDAIQDYDKDRLDIIRKTLPPLTTRTAETGPVNLSYPAYTWTKLHGFAVQSHESPVKAEEVSMKDALDMAGIFPTMDSDHPFSSLWAFHFDYADQRWCVMGRFATMPLRKSVIHLSALGLDESKEYAAFDFWEQKYLGKVKETLNCKELQIGQCQIVCLREVQTHPQFLASSRHVSMDAVSVAKVNWQNDQLVLSLKSIYGKSEAYYVLIPHDYQLRKTFCTGANIQQDQDGELLKISVLPTEKTVQLQLNFEKGSFEL